MPAGTLKPVKRAPLLYQTVQEAIQTYIIENALRPGAALPAESELARQLQVSRNSVREGVKALESVGILETRRGSGVFVKDFSFDPLLETLPYALLSEIDDLVDLLQIRCILEVSMMPTTMQAITAETLAKLQRVVERMRVSAEQGKPFPEEDQEFHRLLFENLQNRILLKLLDLFWLMMHKALQHSREDIGDLNPVRTYQDHVLILDAVMRGDAEQACDALRRHYAGIEERLRRAQERRRPVSP